MGCRARLSRPSRRRARTRSADTTKPTPSATASTAITCSTCATSSIDAVLGEPQSDAGRRETTPACTDHRMRLSGAPIARRRRSIGQLARRRGTAGRPATACRPSGLRSTSGDRRIFVCASVWILERAASVRCVDHRPEQPPDDATPTASTRSAARPRHRCFPACMAPAALACHYPAAAPRRGRRPGCAPPARAAR